MALTDAERQEFAALTKDSYDPDLWTEDDLPFLREFKRQFAETLARESEALASTTPAERDESCDPDETRNPTNPKDD